MSKRLPWIWTGIVIVTSVALLALGAYDVEGFGSVVAAAGWLALPILYTGLGALLLVRRPGNRIAWLLLVVGLGVILDSAAQPFIREAPASPTTLDYLMILLANTMWMVIFFPLFLLLHLFPHGRFLTPKWSWAGWLSVAMFVTLVVVGGLGPEIGEPNGNWVIDNPMAVFSTNIFDEYLAVPWFLGLLALSLGGLVAMVVRFRRSSSVIRTQIKWVVYAGVVLALTYAVNVLVVTLGASWGEGLVAGFGFVFSIALIPIAITAAILRYKLFEIDRIISRTLTYAVVVIVLAGVYTGAVAAITSLLPTQNSLAVAGSTLLVAALFNSLRKRVQTSIDRRFNRSGYHAQQISDEFAAHVRSGLTTEELSDRWVRTVNEALQPTSAGIWLNVDG